MQIKPWSLLWLLLLLAGCSVTGGESSSLLDTKVATVTGTVTYRERIALPPDAVVEIKLLDVSPMDVAATLIAEQAIIPQHQVPIAFALPYTRSTLMSACLMQCVHPSVLVKMLCLQQTAIIGC